MFGTDHLLREILTVLEINARAQLVTAAELRITNSLLRKLLDLEEPKPVTGFTFTLGDTPMLPFNPGVTGIVITITPLPAGVVLTQAAPTTVSSDPTNFPVTVDSTGLIATFGALGSTLGATATLTTSYTNADGTVASTTSQPWGPIVAPVTDVTGFTFAQTT